MGRDVGASAPWRCPWTLTAVGGTFRRGAWLRTRGGSVAQSAAVHIGVDAGVPPYLVVEVMVAEDEHALAGAIAYVDAQASIAPGGRVADVAQADDGVAGADAVAPSRQQVPVHLLDAPERAVPDEQDRAVGQVQVGPDSGPLGRRLDDRDRGSPHRSGQLRLGASTGVGRGRVIEHEVGFPEGAERFCVRWV